MTVRGRDGIKSAYRDESLVDDYISSRFDDAFGAEVHRQQVDHINDAIYRARPASLLEIACGPARLTTELVRVDRSVGLEQSPAMIAKARVRLGAAGRHQWRLIAADAFDLPFPDRSFDMVVTAKFLRHFNREDRRRLLGGIRRVLRPGGALVFDVARASAYRWLLAKWGVAGSWVDDYWFEREAFLAEMREDGFRVDALHPVHALVQVQHYLFSYFHPRLPRLATAVSRQITALAPFAPYEWVVVCRSA
jgi:ubiquinone/menaquinone biosynthesis C-methylase UbiE